tara:strand:- start:370 stop:630 length:261 start_codon:yes stop_codon:yes gene_type:complete
MSLSQSREDVYIRLSEEDLFKLDIIDSAYEEIVSKKVVIREMINIMLKRALEILYVENQITKDGFNYAASLLPDYLEQEMREKLGN